MTESATGHATAPALDGRALSTWQKIAYSLGNVGTNMAPGLIAGWIGLYYIGRPVAPGSETKIFLVSAGVLAALNFMGKIVDALSNPLVGHFSDKWTTRWGRRTPWVVVGSPLMALFLAMLWFPPDDHVTRANTVWIGIGMAGVWFTYTAVVAPYLSLLPEITPYANERVTLSTMMSVADVLGMILMSVVIGTVIEGFSGGLALGPLVMKDGYQVAGVLTAIVMAGCFFASVLFVKENPTGEIKPVEFSFGEAAAACLKNPAFWPYILAVTVLRFGVDLLVGMIPFMVVGLMGYREGTAGALQGVIILLAAVFLPLVAARANKRGKKRIFAEALVWFAIVLPLLGLVWHAPFVGWGVALVARLFGVTMTHPQVMIAHVAGLFVASAVPISAIITLTRPLIADIMDHDEKLTGYRREAMYNGMEGLLTKTSQGLAWALLPVLMTYAGNTPSRPWGVVATGPICGLAVFLGWLSFRRHPFDY